jgi:hypothetical protein
MVATPVLQETPLQIALRNRVRELCARYPDEYWRKLDRERAYSPPALPLSEKRARGFVTFWTA